MFSASQGVSAPELYRFTGGSPATAADFQSRYERQVRGVSPDGSEWWMNWIVRLRGDELPIGYAQATIDRATGLIWLGWVIGVDWQGKGFAKEAVSAVRQRLRSELVDHGVAREFRAAIHRNHAASQGVARHVGLVRTADVRDGEEIWAGT